MTSTVTVDAHAGWPILVTTLRGEPSQNKTVEVNTVLPYTITDFYIHSGLQILSILEQPR